MKNNKRILHLNLAFGGALSCSAWLFGLVSGSNPSPFFHHLPFLGYLFLVMAPLVWSTGKRLQKPWCLRRPFLSGFLVVSLYSYMIALGACLVAMAQAEKLYWENLHFVFTCPLAMTLWVSTVAVPALILLSLSFGGLMFCLRESKKEEETL